jgi:hypothetical protein
MQTQKFRPDVFQGTDNHPQCVFFEQFASSPDPDCDFYGLLLCHMDESEKSAERCKGDYLKCPLAHRGKRGKELDLADSLRGMLRRETGGG